MNRLNLQITNPLTDAAWDSLLLSHPGYSFFHSSAWAKVLREAYHYKPAYFTFVENGNLKVLVPVMQVDSFLTGKRGVSLPFTDYNDAIVSKDIFFGDIFNHMIQYGRNFRWKSLELRGEQNPGLPVSMSRTYSRHILNFRGKKDGLFSSLSANTRRNIKKADKSGVKVEICHSLDSIQEFHALNCMTRKRHGLPPQPFSFFKKVFEHILSKELGFVVLATYQNVRIAGAVYFHLGEKAYFKYGASDKNFHHLRPNNLVMWEAIKWYSENGFKNLCFGRTEPENQGLIQFKSGWSTTEQHMNYYRYDLRKNSFVPDSLRVTGFHNRIFKSMPAPVLNAVGALLYRHFA